MKSYYLSILLSTSILFLSQNVFSNSITKKIFNDNFTEQNIQSQTSNAQVQKTEKKDESVLNKNVVFNIKTYGFYNPVKELVVMYDNEFNTMVVILNNLNKQLNDSVTKVKSINQKTADIEKKLSDKKNENSDKFSKEIIFLNKKLKESRYKDKLFNINFQNLGLNLTKELTTLSIDKVKIYNTHYNSVIQNVKSYKLNLTTVLKVDSIVITQPVVKPENYVLYAGQLSQILYWYQNEIKFIKNVIELGNKKMSDRLAKIAALNTDIENSKKQIESYKSDPKAHKDEISDLNKQIDKSNKEVKDIISLMKDDNNELQDLLKQMNIDAQENFKERINDIIENVSYLYQEKICL